MPDPLTLALLALVAALLRGDRAQAAQIMGRLEADGVLTPSLEISEGANQPQLVWETRRVHTEPTKLFELNASPRRRVIIWNTASVSVRVADAANTIQAGGGGLLEPGAILVDEAPHPHAGEWWARATAEADIVVAQLT